MNKDNETREAIKSMRNRTMRMEHEGDFWTEENKEELIEKYADGFDISEIALGMGRSERAVMQMMDKLGLFDSQVCTRRHRVSRKNSGCLCDVCVYDESLCPRAQHDQFKEDEA